MTFQQFENKFEKFGIRNLNNFIVAFYVVGLIIQLSNPYIYLRYLALNTQSLLKGEIWRVVTFLFYPPMGASSHSMISIILAGLIIYVYYNLTTILLRFWSDFQFTLYFLIGVIGHILGGLIVTLVTGEGMLLTPTYLSFSIFIAFALTFPDTQFLYMFLIPIKAKYLAYFELAIFVLDIFLVPLQDKICIIASLLNVFLLLYFYNRDSLKNFFNFRRRF